MGSNELLAAKVEKKRNFSYNFYLILDDQLLRRFIVTCYRDLEETKKLIDLCYTMRSQIPELFEKRDPFDKDIIGALEHG